MKPWWNDIVTVDPGSSPDHEQLGGETCKFTVRRVKEINLDF
jgi:hypothetical protein